MSEKIKVPDVEHPYYCWKQNTGETPKWMFWRCTFKKGHEGPHSWELKNAADLETRKQ